MAWDRVLIGLARVCLALLLVGPLLGCRSIPPPKPGEFETSATTNGPPKVVAHFPSRPYDFSACQKLNPIWWFGNADDPEPPPSYRTNQACRTVMWYFRNPCHNFTF